MSDVASFSSEHALPLVVVQPANTDVEMLPVDAEAISEDTMASVEEQAPTDRRPTRTDRRPTDQPSDRPTRPINRHDRPTTTTDSGFWIRSHNFLHLFIILLFKVKTHIMF